MAVAAGPAVTREALRGPRRVGFGAQVDVLREAALGVASVLRTSGLPDVRYDGRAVAESL